MFIMKCLLSINSVENNEPIIRSIKPSAVNIKHSVSNLVDTAEITLPRDEAYSQYIGIEKGRFGLHHSVTRISSYYSSFYSPCED